MDERKREPWLIVEDLLRVIRLYQAGSTHITDRLLNRAVIEALKDEAGEYLKEIYTSP